MNLKLKRTPGIYLVGFMGSGKTTIGRILADEIGWRFADLDEDIEVQQRKSISELFASVGEGEFRRIEAEAMHRRVNAIKRGTPTVLALGGGTFSRQENADILLNHGVVIWIDTDFSIVKRRAEGSSHRPLARDPEEFERLYRNRRPLYSRADYQIVITEDNHSRAAVAQILKLPFWAQD